MLVSSCTICELQLCTKPSEPALTPCTVQFMTYYCLMISYIFLYADSEKRNIFLAMYEWENHTCVRFKPRSTEEKHYVAFVPGVG